MIQTAACGIMFDNHFATFNSDNEPKHRSPEESMPTTKVNLRGINEVDFISTVNSATVKWWSCYSGFGHGAEAELHL